MTPEQLKEIESDQQNALHEVTSLDPFSYTCINDHIPALVEEIRRLRETLKRIAECGVDYQSINRARSAIGEEGCLKGRVVLTLTRKQANALHNATILAGSIAQHEPKKAYKEMEVVIESALRGPVPRAVKFHPSSEEDSDG